MPSHSARPAQAQQAQISSEPHGPTAPTDGLYPLHQQVAVADAGVRPGRHTRDGGTNTADATNVALSVAKAGNGPTAATSTPPMAGPATATTAGVDWLKPIAAGNISRGTTLVASVARAGEQCPTESTPCWGSGAK